MNDPQKIWQGQPTEPLKMAVSELRRRALRRHNRARFRALSAIWMGILLCAAFGRNVSRVHDFVPRIGWAVIAVWSGYFAWRAYLWFWPGRLRADATLDETVRSYRTGLERQRDYYREIWRKAGLPFCLLGLALIVTPRLVQSIEEPRRLGSVAPVIVMLFAWLVVFVAKTKRDRRRLQREIEELRTAERN